MDTRADTTYEVLPFGRDRLALLLHAWSANCGRVDGELGAVGDAELRVGVREVGLDGAAAHEEASGDLWIGGTAGGELCYLSFGRG